MLTGPEILNLVLLPFVVSYQGLTLFMVVSSVFEIRRLRTVPPALLAESAVASGQLPPVSVVVPAYNEETTVIRTIESLLALRYPEFEIIVVSDGSTDGTIAVLLDRFALAVSRNESRHQLMTQRVRRAFQSTTDPRLIVLDKRNGGKADALNAGIDYARFPLVLVLDADVFVERDALTHLAVPFTMDPSTIASSGIIRPQNGCEIRNGRLVAAAAPATWVERMQAVEYIRAYSIGRIFFNRFNAQLIISGAFGLFSRRLLLDLGGYQTHAVGEDMELLVRAHRYLIHRTVPYKIAFAPDALCLTEAPHSMNELGRQRTRWHQGLLTTLRLHRSMAGRRRYGAAGVLAFPYYVLELFYPFLELVGWAGLVVLFLVGSIRLTDVVRFAAVTILLGSAVSLAALWVDSVFFSFFANRVDRSRLALAALVEQFGYRQCTVYFRLRAFVRYYRSLQLRTAWRPPSRAVADPTPKEGAI